jgi:hypothetical protein
MVAKGDNMVETGWDKKATYYEEILGDEEETSTQFFVLVYSLQNPKREKLLQCIL